ncbi:hypothetical protein [Flavobacterium sp.]|uniref:hypothetical protein n=1 Tax=Flavobacterium sp. TaxID=239 RepID=UPI002B4AB4DB|nr:hypothetical protein [Flavobacterium sp.]HLP63983.1 hypothetical protein [Flavobacterium sp.]
MKRVKLTIAVVFVFTLSAFSQNGYNRNNSMSTPTQNSEPTKEEIEKAREESLNKLMTRLTEDLKLDALQVVAIRQIYTDNMKKQGIILKKEDSNEAKTEALKSLSESTEIRVLALLNPQQKERYELLKNEAAIEKDKKKGKKDKKKNKE